MMYLNWAAIKRAALKLFLYFSRVGKCQRVRQHQINSTIANVKDVALDSQI